MRPTVRSAARGLAVGCEVIAALILIAVTCINLAQVVGRYFIGTSIPWAEEIMRYVMMWLMMLGSVACIYRAEHMAIDSVIQSVPERWRQHMRSLLYSIGGLFCLLLVIYGWHAALANNMQFAAASGIRMSIPYMAIPIGGTLIIVEIVLCWLAGYEPAEPTEEPY